MCSENNGIGVAVYQILVCYFIAHEHYLRAYRVRPAVHEVEPVGAVILFEHKERIALGAAHSRVRSRRGTCRCSDSRRFAQASAPLVSPGKDPCGDVSPPNDRTNRTRIPYTSWVFRPEHL